MDWSNISERSSHDHQKKSCHHDKHCHKKIVVCPSGPQGAQGPSGPPSAVFQYNGRGFIDPTGDEIATVGFGNSTTVNFSDPLDLSNPDAIYFRLTKGGDLTNLTAAIRSKSNQLFDGGYTLTATVYLSNAADYPNFTSTPLSFSVDFLSNTIAQSETAESNEVVPVNAGDIVALTIRATTEGVPVSFVQFTIGAGLELA